MEKTNKKLQKIQKMLTLNINKPKKKSNTIILLVGVVIGFVNGFFGGGGGMLCVPSLTFLCGKEDKKAHATTLFIMLPLCVVSFVIYILVKPIDLNNSLFVIIGFVVGGFIGANLLKKLKSIWIEIIFCFVTAFCGIRLIIGG